MKEKIKSEISEVMGNKIMCSQCKYLRKGEGKEDFVSPQGIHTTVHHGRYYCEADFSYHFTDEQIKEFKECSYFRPRALTLTKEIQQRTVSFLKQIFQKWIKSKINLF